MRTFSLVPAMFCLLVAACGTPAGSNAPSTPSLTIRARMTTATSSPYRVGAFTAPGVRLAPGGPAAVDPATFTQTFYKLYLSQSADCSNLTLVDDVPAGITVDILQSPTVFSVSPANGTYPCVGLQQSDVLAFSPASTSGVCVAGTTYTVDIYRQGATDFKNVDGSSLAGSGTDAAPVNDKPLTLMTTDTAATIARGFSRNQIVRLGAPLVVPGAVTFVYDGRGTVVNEASEDGVTRCRIDPGAPTFQ